MRTCAFHVWVGVPFAQALTLTLACSLGYANDRGQVLISSYRFCEEQPPAPLIRLR